MKLAVNEVVKEEVKAALTNNNPETKDNTETHIA